jgi:Ca-activated chloride channel family protein
MRALIRCCREQNLVVLLGAILVLTTIGPDVAGQTPKAKDDPVEVIKVDTKLVELKVSVLCPHSVNPIPVLNPTDFAITEDGKPQTVQFFAAAEAPFDLVLLLDVSGSSSGKIKLIRKSAERFVQAARPNDRVAVLTFSGELKLIAPLNSDREQLIKDLKNIKVGSGTNFWDSLRYTVTHLPSEHSSGRRTAVVVMTDGVDNAIQGERGYGSETTFPQLLEFVRASSAIVLPIYLDTEKEMLKKAMYQMTAASYATARDQLKAIAAEGGSTLYYASRLEDLNGVYEQVIRDLGTVYSIGYESDRDPDGTWRKVAVAIPGHPELTVRTRPGYYAKPEGSNGQ